MMKRNIRKVDVLPLLNQQLEENIWKRDAMKMAIRILDTLEEREMTQKELADKMGKKPQWVNRICKGQENMTIGTIREIENALGLKLMEIPKPQTKVYPARQEPNQDLYYISENSFKLSKLDYYSYIVCSLFSEKIDKYKTILKPEDARNINFDKDKFEESPLENLVEEY